MLELIQFSVSVKKSWVTLGIVIKLAMSRRDRGPSCSYLDSDATGDDQGVYVAHTLTSQRSIHVFLGVPKASQSRQ